ncbi:hypothetical protein [Paenibacillus polymyxa]|uniref:hypothetical protein n=1 Tax=Paenibacillus polymyxa TaxID=1406 RepID=UPI00046F1D6D|nr:hypothetical protein [Paenibacillus polymyxa]
MIHSKPESKTIGEWKNVMANSSRVFWCNEKRLDAVPKILDTYGLLQDMQFSLHPNSYSNTGKILLQLIHAIYGLTPESILPELRCGREEKMSLYSMLSPGNYDEAVWDALEDGEDLSIIFGEQTLELSARAFYGILVMLRDRKISYEQRY